MAEITQIKIDQQVYNIKDFRTTEQFKQEMGIPDIKTQIVTLTTNWTGSSAPFYQDVPFSGLKSTDTPILDVVVTNSNYDMVEAEWAEIFRVECLADKLRFYTKSKTTSNISVIVKVV